MNKNNTINSFSRRAELVSASDCRTTPTLPTNCCCHLHQQRPQKINGLPRLRLAMTVKNMWLAMTAKNMRHAMTVKNMRHAMTEKRTVFASKAKQTILMFLIAFLTLCAGRAMAQTETLFFNVANGTFYLDDVLTVPYTEQTSNYIWDGITLTLTNFVWETSKETALKIVNGNITLELVGTNTFVSTSSGTNDSYGIYIEGSLTIIGTGELYATAGDVTTAGCGIYADGNIDIDGGTVEANGGNMIGDHGILTSSGNITISGGTVTAFGGSKGVSSVLFTISGGIITAAGYEFGILGDNAIVISGGIVTATAHGGGYSLATEAGGTISIGGGTVTATGGAGAFDKAPTALPNTYRWEKSDDINGIINYEEGIYPAGTAYSYNAAHLYVKIATLCTLTAIAEPDEGGSVKFHNLQHQELTPIDGTVDGIPCGEAVVLSAWPHRGFKFAGWWSGSQSQQITSQGAVLVKVTSDTVITAKFDIYDPPDFPVEISYIGGDEVTSADLEALFGLEANDAGQTPRFIIANFTGVKTFGENFVKDKDWIAGVKIKAGNNLTVGSSAFRNTWSKNVLIEAEADENIEMEIKDYSFSNNSRLETVNIYIKPIEPSFSPFNSFSSLSSNVAVANITVGSGAFAENTQLRTVSIGGPLVAEMLPTIPGNGPTFVTFKNDVPTFYNCPKLRHIYLPEIPPNLECGVCNVEGEVNVGKYICPDCNEELSLFGGTTNISKITLYIPAGFEDDYAAHPYWGLILDKFRGVKQKRTLRGDIIIKGGGTLRIGKPKK